MTQTKYNNDYTGSKSGELIQDIIEEHKFLLKLVDTIPAKMYFDHDIQERITSDKHMKMDEKAEGITNDFLTFSNTPSVLIFLFYLKQNLMFNCQFEYRHICSLFKERTTPFL